MVRLLMLVFAGLKFGKLFVTVGSMLLAMAVYGVVFGWRYGVGLVLMLGLHELGRFIAARRRGLAMQLPMFIPFVGAWSKMGDQPRDAETDAYMALGATMMGTVGAIVAYYFARNDELPWLLAVSYAGFFINLICLIPLPPLDGGRITAVLSPRIWLLGVPVLGMLLWYRFSPMLLVIAILAVPYVIAALKFKADSPEAIAYYQVSERVRWEYAIVYIALLAYLGMMVNDVDRQLRALNGEPPRQSESI
jgi:Zn-dependent protease